MEIIIHLQELQMGSIKKIIFNIHEPTYLLAMGL